MSIALEERSSRPAVEVEAELLSEVLGEPSKAGLCLPLPSRTRVVRSAKSTSRTSTLTDSLSRGRRAAGRPSGHVFRSESAGQSWTRAAEGPTNVAAVAVNPSTPSEVYAVTADGRIFRSANGGSRWELRR